MKVEVKALRDFPYNDNPNQPDEIKRAKKGDKFEVNLTKARAWQEAGKISFTDPADEEDDVRKPEAVKAEPPVAKTEKAEKAAPKPSA